MNKSIEGIIKVGLIYWIKSQCQKINNIEIQINLSFKGFLNYSLNHTEFSAEDIIFKNLFINKISIIADQINLKLNPINTNNKLILMENDFDIDAELIFNESSINNILESKDWEWLLLLLKNTFLDNNDFIGVIFDNDQFLIKTIDPSKTKINENYFHLNVNNGKLFIKETQSSEEIELPIDEAIKIKSIHLRKTYLSITIESEVKV